MIAILSDIHGNLEALQAVLDDAQHMSAESVFSLGDLVGYGPDPCACVQIAMHWDHVLRGNFDDALVHPARYADWPDQLSQMMQRLHRQIRQHEDGEQMLAFLARCPTSYSSEKSLFVHGSPRDHLREYVFPEHIYAPDKMASIFACFDTLCFCGHSHMPGLFLPAGESEWLYVEPAQCDDVYSVANGKLLCNVGSVGQPRDGDARASYVLFDGQRIIFRRVDYDFQTTIEKLRDGDDDDMHGNRLPHGR